VAKTHILKGTDCFNDDMALAVTRNRDTVKVETEHGDKFCCKYDRLAEIVKAMEPKKKKAKLGGPDKLGGPK